MKRLLAVLFAVALLVTSVTPAQAAPSAGSSRCYKKTVTVVRYVDGRRTVTNQKITVCWSTTDKAGR